MTPVKTKPPILILQTHVLVSRASVSKSIICTKPKKKDCCVKSLDIFAEQSKLFDVMR